MVGEWWSEASTIGCGQQVAWTTDHCREVSWPCMKRFAARVTERPLPSCGQYSSGVWLHHSEALRLELLTFRLALGHWPISSGGGAKVAPVPWFSGDRACRPEAGSLRANLSRLPVCGASLAQGNGKKPGRAGSFHCQPRTSPDCLSRPLPINVPVPLTIFLLSHLSSSASSSQYLDTVDPVEALCPSILSSSTSSSITYHPHYRQDEVLRRHCRCCWCCYRPVARPLRCTYCQPMDGCLPQPC